MTTKSTKYQNHWRGEHVQQRNQPPPPPPSLPPQAPEENHNQRNWNPEGVERNMTDSLKILNLPRNASNNTMKKQFRRLPLTYHPDRYSPLFGLTQEEAIAYFQMLNNANEFLRGQ
jgi:hypothetical protein